MPKEITKPYEATPEERAAIDAYFDREQKVTVEHVHVHHGGQAIVGNVSTGGGDDTKN